MPPAFQPILIALLSSFAVVVAIGPTTIRMLRRMKVGDVAEFDQAKINELMAGKRGTPTMGGLMIALGVAAGALLSGVTFHPAGLILTLAFLAFAALGSVDDRMKLRRSRLAAQGIKVDSTRQGLSSRAKLLLQFVIATAAVGSWMMFDPNQSQAFLHAPAVGGFLEVGRVAAAVFAIFLVVGMSNAVNITDGLDGLAGSTVAIAAFTLGGLAVFASESNLAARFGLNPTSSETAPLAFAVAGACCGFLVFNRPPARVFMGDTGSLALGGLLGLLAVVLRVELLLVLIGGVFVVEAASVMLQVGFFKYTKKRFGEGRRIFRMAPLHHHFQLGGLNERQIVGRFIAAAGLLAVAGLTLALARGF